MQPIDAVFNSNSLFLLRIFYLSRSTGLTYVRSAIGSQGRISDGGVLRNTVFDQALDSDQLNVPKPIPLPANDLMNLEDWNPVLPHYFLGDDAFSLTPK